MFQLFFFLFTCQSNFHTHLPFGVLILNPQLPAHLFCYLYLIFISYPSFLSDLPSPYGLDQTDTHPHDSKTFPQPASLAQKHAHTACQIADLSITLDRVQPST